MKWLQRPRDRLAGTLPAATTLMVIGLCWFAIAGWNFLGELRTVEDIAFPVLAFLLTGGLSGGVVAAGYRLSRSRYSPDERWSIVGWTAAGLTLTVLLQGTTLAIRAAEGRPIGEPQFPLLTVGGVGALAGYGIGVLLIDVRRTAAEAKEARDGMAFTNSLLRHDIGNALQVILGQVGVLTSIDDERAREAGQRIESQVEAMQELTKNADAVARVLTDEAVHEPRDLTADIESIIATVDESFPSATIEADLHDRLVVRGTDALKPALANIITNAVEHTGTEPTVRVTSDTIDDMAVIRIEDDGPGIPPEHRATIFRRGVTADGGNNGLGLHIVSTIIERSGGEIHVEDSDLGGAAFVVELPLAEP